MATTINKQKNNCKQECYCIASAGVKLFLAVASMIIQVNILQHCILERLYGLGSGMFIVRGETMSLQHCALVMTSKFP